MNEKYEITGIAHEKYPFLHRIRALRDIGSEVKAGDLGGFVECESNLSFDSGDDAWIFGDAIAAGEGYVDKGSILRDRAVVCGCAYVSHGSEMSGDSRAEDSAYLRGARLSRFARASGNSMILQSADTQVFPILTGNCAVYGKVVGDVMLAGAAVVISGEEIINDSLDTLSVDERGRTILRDPSRDKLTPSVSQAKEKKKSQKGREYDNDQSKIRNYRYRPREISLPPPHPCPAGHWQRSKDRRFGRLCGGRVESLL